MTTTHLSCAPGGAAGLVSPVIHILPELLQPRRRGLTLLVLADGNRRSAAGGYAGGARNVIAMAEHLARRPDVAALVACILSPDNIARRGDGFFEELRAEFVRLGVAIETRGALVASGIRLEVHGDLGLLRARGGRAAALADAIDAVVAGATRVDRPRLRLILGVGYGRETTRELDVDIVVRFGMEEERALRLSGLESRPFRAHYASTRLWPEVEPRDLDAIIDDAKLRAPAVFAEGHGLDTVLDLARALALADLAAPLQITLPSSAEPAALLVALGRLYRGALRDSRLVTITHPAPDGGTDIRHGFAGAPRAIRVLPRAPFIAMNHEMAPAAPAAILAPGQEPPRFILPAWPPIGFATLHACEPDAAGLLDGVRAALHFIAAHPPLLGADRRVEAPPKPADPPWPRRFADLLAAIPPLSHLPITQASEALGHEMASRDDLADLFCAKALCEAESAGLLLPSASARRASLNYALTAFHIHDHVGAEWDERAAAWEERAALAARYMLAIAAGDEGIFDRVIDGEARPQRLARLQRAAHFLVSALHEMPAAPPPDDGALLGAIAEQWTAIAAQWRSGCHPAIFEAWRRGLADLYRASVAEHDVDLHQPFDALLADARRLADAPPTILARVRDLADSIEGRGAAAHDEMNELRVLLYLADAGAAVGAGLLFRTAALAAPAEQVTPARAEALSAVASLVDYGVRLANDLSGFLSFAGGDRDPKANACSILVPQGASSTAREAAVIQAIALCRRLAAWLEREAQRELVRLRRVWPSMAAVVRRGLFIGGRVYELGHYTTLSREAMSAVADELEAQEVEDSGRPTRAPDDDDDRLRSAG